MQVTTSRHARAHAFIGPKILAKRSIPENSCADRVRALVKTPTHSDSGLPFRLDYCNSNPPLIIPFRAFGSLQNVWADANGSARIGGSVCRFLENLSEPCTSTSQEVGILSLRHSSQLTTDYATTTAWQYRETRLQAAKNRFTRSCKWAMQRPRVLALGKSAPFGMTVQLLHGNQDTEERRCYFVCSRVLARAAFRQQRICRTTPVVFKALHIPSQPISRQVDHRANWTDDYSLCLTSQPDIFARSFINFRHGLRNACKSSRMN